MAFTKAALVRNTLALVLIGLLALSGIVGTTWFLVEKSNDFSEDIFVARRARASLVDLLNLLQQAETSQRGYLLNQQDLYLRPYRDARARLPEQIARVETLYATTDDRRTGFADVLDRINQKLAEMNETVRLTESGALRQAIDLLSTDRGVLLMDEIRLKLGAMIQSLDAGLVRLADDQRAYGAALSYMSLGGGLIILLVAAGAAWTVFLYMKELANARHELETLNAGLETRVRERTEDLASANEEIQRFAYIVTHDLRAPLVNIMGFTSELQTSLAPLQAVVDDPAGATPKDVEAAQLAAREDLPEAIGFIRASTRKMDGLINAILRLSREGRRVRKPESLQLPAMIEAAGASIQHQVSQAEGEIATDLSLREIVSDRLSLEQIIGNILDNAVKYRDKQRPLRIAIRTRPKGPDHFTLEIEDNGRGVAAQDHVRIFELFRRSGAQDQTGEGIGLAHVKALVRSLGGTISIVSELGKGATFVVQLPRDLRAHLGNGTEFRAA